MIGSLEVCSLAYVLLKPAAGFPDFVLVPKAGIRVLPPGSLNCIGISLTPSQLMLVRSLLEGFSTSKPTAENTHRDKLLSRSLNRMEREESPQTECLLRNQRVNVTHHHTGFVDQDIHWSPTVTQESHTKTSSTTRCQVPTSAKPR